MSEHAVSESREKAIANLYRTVLNREPDAPGLSSYFDSPLSIEDIERDMKASPEYIKLVKSSTFIESLKDTKATDLLVLGSTPTEEEHVKELKNIGIEAVLDLNVVPAKFFKSQWKGIYKHISLSRKLPITRNKAAEALEFMFNTLFVERKKLFVHSELGMSRAPLMVALFLVADRGMGFYEAVKIVVHKHRGVNPRKTAVTADVLSFVREFKNKTDNFGKEFVAVGKATPGGKLVPVSNNLFVSSSFDVDVLVDKGISVIYDISPDGLVQEKIPGISVVSIPVSQDSMGTFLPAILKSTVKRSSKQKVCVVSSDIGALLFYVENVYKEHGQDLDGIVDLNKVRMSFFSGE